jgi:MFS family permease
MSVRTPAKAESRWASAWHDHAVQLAVALAFADASIVVLALPQIVGELDTTISHVTWVIMSYNLALIVGVFAFALVARRVDPRRAVLVGLAVFGLASVGCAVAGSLEELVGFRSVQGLGGALLVCGSLPLLARSTRVGRSETASWAAAAAIGAAVGPAAGGILTELFDWRAIFVAQAPAALLAALAVLSVTREPGEAAPEDAPSRPGLGPAVANVALLLLSAALIGALFLVVLLLINIWRLEPIAAAAVVSALPVTTAVFERVARGRSPLLVAAVGAILLALGLLGVAVPSHKELGWVFIALVLSGAGLGMSFTALTDAALKGRGPAAARAARTVAARDAGLVLGLLLLTPVFVHDLDGASARAVPPLAVAIYGAPMSKEVKDEVAKQMIKTYSETPQGKLPDFGPTFATVRAEVHPDAATTRTLAVVHTKVDAVVERVATQSFHRALRYCALFAVAVLPLLALAGMSLFRGSSPSPERP